LEVVFAEHALLVDNEVDALPALGEQVVLQRRRAEIGVHDVARLRVDIRNPLGKLHRIRDRGREEHIVHLARQKNDRLFPHDAALLVAHVVDLVKDDPRDFAHNLRAAVQHGAQNLGRHHQARRTGIDRHVTRHQADIVELGGKLTVLLVRQGLDGRRVHDSLAIAQRLRNRVLGHNRLTG